LLLARCCWPVPLLSLLLVVALTTMPLLPCPSLEEIGRRYHGRPHDVEAALLTLGVSRRKKRPSTSIATAGACLLVPGTETCSRGVGSPGNDCGGEVDRQHPAFGDFAQLHGCNRHHPDGGLAVQKMIFFPWK